RDDWSVEQIAWSPDGKRLLIASGRAPTFLAERDAPTARVMRYQLPWTEAVAWTADGVPVAAGIPYIDNKPLCQLWRDDPPEVLQSYRTAMEGEQPVWTALSADGRFIVAGCGDTSQGYPSERAAYVFEAATGNVVAHIDHSVGHPGPWQGEAAPHRRWEYAPRYTLSRDGKLLGRCGKHLGGPDLFRADSGATVRTSRHLTTLWQAEVNFRATWSHDSAWLAVRGEDGAIRYYSASTKWPTATSPAPVYGYPGFSPSAAEALNWSLDSERLTTVRGGPHVDVQLARTGQSESIVSAAQRCSWPVFSRDGTLFAGHYDDGRVRVFEKSASRTLKALDAVTGVPVTWSANGKQIAVRNGDATEIWDVEANECVGRFNAGRASLVWSPDGAQFVLSGGNEATVHDARSGNVLHELDDPPIGSAKICERVAWSPDGRYIAGRGRVWDADTGEVVARLPAAALAGEIGAPAWSPDGAKVAYLGPGRAVAVAEIAPKVRHSTAQGETLGNAETKNAVALKGRDSRSATNGAELIRAHGAGESRPVGADDSNAAVTQGSAALHPGLWNLTPSGSPQVAAMLLTFNRGQVLSIAPSGHYRASPRADELLAYVVETADGQETLSREQFAERFGWKNNPQWAEKENGLLGPPSKKRDGVGRATSGMALVQRPAALPGVESWTIAARSPAYPGNIEQPIALSYDGKSLAQAGSDGIVRLIDAASAKVERLLVGHDAPLAAVEFSPDGRLLASLDAVAGNARVWDVGTGAELHSVHIGRGSHFGALHWSPDGTMLAIAVYGLPLRFLEVATGEFLPVAIEAGTLPGPGYVAWSPDSRSFVTHAHDNRQRIWDIRTLAPTVTIEKPFNNGSNVGFAWSPDGATLAAYNANGEIRVWDALSGK
ncbi:MAG: hypothetical protein ACREHD_21555, partial [Pirellulales bacterium]